MRIKRFVQATLVAGVLGVGLVGSASAAQLEPGVPGTKNCQGQQVAFLAQIARPTAPGIGNIARAGGLSVPELHETVDEFCEYIDY